MAMIQDALETIMTQLDRQIGQLASTCQGRTTGQIAEELDSIRIAARDNGLYGIAEMSHALESALGRIGGPSGAQALLTPWLDAMHGLLAHDPANVGAARSWMAALSHQHRS